MTVLSNSMVKVMLCDSEAWSALLMEIFVLETFSLCVSTLISP